MPFLGTLVDKGTVYTTDANGNYNVVVKDKLRCRVIAPQIRPVDVGRERNELTDLRYLSYDPKFTFPNEWCQIEVNDVRYNTVAGTFRIIRGPTSKRMLKRADLVRAS